MWRFDGLYYFKVKQGFSINEGCFPNVSILWGSPFRNGWAAPYVYFAISSKFKWHN